jgi:hypothetical protein
LVPPRLTDPLLTSTSGGRPPASFLCETVTQSLAGNHEHRNLLAEAGMACPGATDKYQDFGGHSGWRILRGCDAHRFVADTPHSAQLQAQLC